MDRQGKPSDVLTPFNSSEEARNYLVRWNWEPGYDEDHFVKTDPNNEIVLSSAFIVPTLEHIGGRG